MFEQLYSSTVTPEVGKDIVNAIASKRRALQLSELAFKVGQGLETEETLQAFLSTGPKVEVKDNIIPETTDLSELIQHAYSASGLRWRLDFLNKSLGSLREGDFGFLFKRPETGGTAFCASEVGNWLTQVDRPIVWINNEESNAKVLLRIYQAYFGVTLDVILSNVPLYRECFQSETKGNLLFFGIEYSNKTAVERIVAKYKPRVVLYDQLDKVGGFQAERLDLELGAKYEWARNLAKLGHSALGITQADGTAEGVKYLTMNHVSSAKTSKQAEADFILGLGKSHDDNQEYMRYINVCKNKLLGDVDSIPEFRHGKMEVMIEPEIMRFKDIIKYS